MRLKNNEHCLQKNICLLLKLNNVFFFETDVMDGLKFCNSKNTRLSFINHHKSMGYKNGQPDLILVLPKRIVFVELKNGSKGVMSEHQKEFKKMVESLGFEFLCWRKIEDCQEFIKNLKKSENNFEKDIDNKFNLL